MKKHIYSISFSLVLAAFTLFVVLDTFVISRPMEYVQGQTNTAMFSQSQRVNEAEHSTDDSASDVNASGNPTDDSETESREEPSDRSGNLISTDGAKLIGEYENQEASIKLYEYNYESTAVYVADIVVSSSEYIKTAFAKGYYGKNVTEKTSSMAEQNDAILAINGDYYGARENGYVIRNGVVYRDTSDGRDLLCVYADGTMRIVDSDAQSAQTLVEQGVWQAYSFGPALVKDGQVDVAVNAEVGKAMASNPRTAIGMIDTCHYVFVVSDGRTSESKGLSLFQLATFMQEIGVDTAYNLDGGGSSTLYFNGEIINYPTTSGRSMKERGVSDIVYIGK